MAKITDPDYLIVSSTYGNLGIDGNIWVDVATKLFYLAAYDSLVLKDGVTLQAVYSKFVDLWTSDAYNKYPFPMYTIDYRSGQFIIGFDGSSYSGWAPGNDQTRETLRDAGWEERSAAGGLNRVYVGMVALASGYPTGAQMYYQRESTEDGIEFKFDDAPNQGIQVYQSGSPAFDKRSFFKLFCREYNYTYDDAVLGDVGETGTGAYKVSLPIAVGADLNITADDTAVDANTPYTQINIKYFSAAFSREVGTGVVSSFGIVIDVGTHSGVDGSAPGGGSVLTSTTGGMTPDMFNGGVLTTYIGTTETEYPITDNDASTITVSGTIPSGSNISFTAQRATPIAASLSQIYTKVQRQLRNDSNINAVSGGTTVKGNIAAMLLNFVGSSLKCGFYNPGNPAGGGIGVLIQGWQTADMNDMVFRNNSGVDVWYPFASVGSLNFNSFLTLGGAGYYRMYFTTLPGGHDYGTADAETVHNAAGADIAGVITASSIPFTFDYTNNSQGGRSPGTPAAVTVVAGNPNYGKPVVAEGTITASKTISITLTAEQDRGYVA